MALQSINVGNIVNDGTGDDLRTAFIKINNNFDELDLRGGQANTISNLGTGVGVYKEKIGVDLKLKSLVAGPGITLTNNPNDITITNNRNMILTVNASTGTLTAASPTQALNIVGTDGITTSISGNTLTITGSGDYSLLTDNNPKLGANLDLNGYDILGYSGTSITAEQFNGHLTGNVSGNLTGNVTGLVHNIDIRPLNDIVMSFDFGNISEPATNTIQFILSIIDFDMGFMDSPNPVSLDLGTLP